MSKLKDLLSKLQTGTATKGSNLLNPEDVLDYVFHLGKRATSQPARLWVHRVLKNWLTHRKTYHRLCLPAHERNSLWLKLLPRVFDAPSVKEIHYVETTPTTPAWVVRGMESLTLTWFQAPSLDSDLHSELCHLVDYLNTLETVSLRMTVDDAMAGVRRWDKKLARQKFVSEYHEGVEVCDSTAFEGLEDQPVLVKLVSKEAYKNEGAAQSNCVATYATKTESVIYSLRVPGEPRALATVEVKNKNVVQAKGPLNSTLASPILSALEAWALKEDFSWFKVDPLPRTSDYLVFNEAGREVGRSRPDGSFSLASSGNLGIGILPSSSILGGGGLAVNYAENTAESLPKAKKVNLRLSFPWIGPPRVPEVVLLGSSPWALSPGMSMLDGKVAVTRSHCLTRSKDGLGLLLLLHVTVALTDAEHRAFTAVAAPEDLIQIQT